MTNISKSLDYAVSSASAESHHKLIVLFTIVILFVLASCAPQQLPQDLARQKSVVLPVRIDSIVFVDERPDTLTTNMDLPAFATKAQEWIVNPGLSKSLQAELFEMIKSTSNPKGAPCTATLIVTDGYYKILGKSSQVLEYTKFDSTIEFEMNDGSGGFKASSSAYNELIGAFNAQEDHVRAMYRITARNSVFTALTYAANASN